MKWLRVKKPHIKSFNFLPLAKDKTYQSKALLPINPNILFIKKYVVTVRVWTKTRKVSRVEHTLKRWRAF